MGGSNDRHGRPFRRRARVAAACEDERCQGRQGGTEGDAHRGGALRPEAVSAPGRAIGLVQTPVLLAMLPSRIAVILISFTNEESPELL
jgi:hypothetical protein